MVNLWWLWSFRCPVHIFTIKRCQCVPVMWFVEYGGRSPAVNQYGGLGKRGECRLLQTIDICCCGSAQTLYSSHRGSSSHRPHTHTYIQYCWPSLLLPPLCKLHSCKLRILQILFYSEFVVLPGSRTDLLCSYIHASSSGDSPPFLTEHFKVNHLAVGSRGRV